MAEDALTISRHFLLSGNPVSAKPLKIGHIHATHVVTCQTGEAVRRYLLQRLNTRVFTDPRSLMANIQRVIDHLTQAMQRRQEPDAARRHLTLVRTRDNATLCRGGEGGWWRMYEIVEGTVVRLTIRTPGQASAIASAYGEFQRLLCDLGPPRLAETIPNFHDPPKRYAELDRAVRSDSAGRVGTTRPEIDMARRHRPLAEALVRLQQSSSVPQRVIHNDAKSSNVLLDAKSGRPLCVVDLDTVMPGLVVWDFGDMVRSMVSPAAEDESDLGKIVVRLDVFQGLVQGYLREADGFLQEIERDNLVTAALVITLEQAVRFLTDYLSGDVYYTTEKPSHNLDRCRNQFRLLGALLEQEEPMRRIVRDVSAADPEGKTTC